MDSGWIGSSSQGDKTSPGKVNMSPYEKPVVLLDLWFTLVFGLKEDPVLTLQRLLRYKEESDGQPARAVDDFFLTLALTTDIRRPARFVRRLARQTTGVTPEADVYPAFRALLRRERGAVGIFPETIEALVRLRRRGYRLGVVSNLWPFAVHRIFVEMGLGQYFDELVFSYALGSRKPHRGIFDAAARSFGVPAEKCLMVGDSLKSDVEGAVAAGMSAALIVRGDQPVPPLPQGAVAIRSLLELAD